MLYCEKQQQQTTQHKSRKECEIMRATNKSKTLENKRTIDTAELQAMLSSGRKTAVEIGTAAQARVQVGRRVLWNVGKIQKYLDAISE